MSKQVRTSPASRRLSYPAERTRLLAVWIAAALALGGCGAAGAERAGQSLALAAAGIAGKDELHFEGEAKLWLAGEEHTGSRMYYGGEMAGHKRVLMYTLVPDGGDDEPRVQTAAEAQTEGETKGSRQENASGWKTEGVGAGTVARLSRTDGNWRVAGLSGADAPYPLQRLNPLQQLERLERMESAGRSVKEGKAPAAGQTLLRIELSSEAARDELRRELVAEMEALRGGDGETVRLYAMPDGAALWQEARAELDRRLERSRVSAVYELIVDAKRNLPRRLSFRRTISESLPAGDVREEAFMSRVDFYGYR